MSSAHMGQEPCPPDTETFSGSRAPRLVLLLSFLLPPKAGAPSLPFLKTRKYLNPQTIERIIK